MRLVWCMGSYGSPLHVGSLQVVFYRPSIPLLQDIGGLWESLWQYCGNYPPAHYPPVKGFYHGVYEVHRVYKVVVEGLGVWGA